MAKLRFLTAGESHGKALLGILEGVPSGLALTVEYLQRELARRKLGFGRGARQKIETDDVEVLSGIRHGKTLGSPIGLVMKNRDWEAWTTTMAVGPIEGEVDRQVEVPRPGHADLVGGLKYAHTDMRNVLERSSARETAMRVALGTVARRLLEECGVRIGSRVVGIGSVTDTSALNVAVGELNEVVDESPVRCLSPEVTARMTEEIHRLWKEGDTLGGVFEVYACGVPTALGSYSQWDRRLEGGIAAQLMSLNAIKGVEVGDGFRSAAVPGSRAHDEIFPGSTAGHVRYETNRAGGIIGGMSTGQTLVVRAAMKPLATLLKPLRSVKLSTFEPAEAHVERSDACAVPAAAVIGESLVALAIADAMLEKFGGDSMKELLPRVEEWNARTRPE